MDARVNETVDDKTLLRAYRLEIEQLKAKLAEVESVMQLKVTEQQPDGVDTEESQLLMLQMIDHMERLILKGEEKAKEEESAKDRKSIEPKREMRSRKSDGVKSTLSSRKVIPPETTSNSSPSVAIKKESPSSVRNEKREADLQTGAAVARSGPKESKIAQRKTNKKPVPPKKSLTLPNPPTATASELVIGPETTEPDPTEELEIETRSNSIPADHNPRALEEEDSEEEQEDFFAGINRNRESLLRASHDANDSQSPASHSRKMLSSQNLKDPDFPSLIESILSGSRESLLPSVGAVDRDKVKDPVLQGVSQMLGLLRQHVQKPKYASSPSLVHLSLLSQTISWHGLYRGSRYSIQGSRSTEIRDKSPAAVRGDRPGQGGTCPSAAYGATPQGCRQQILTGRAREVNRADHRQGQHAQYAH